MSGAEVTEVSGWAGPAHHSGAGYGIRVPTAYRDRVFQQSWKTVTLLLGADEQVTVSVSPSFWRSCNHLNSAVIGRWLLRHGAAPWPKGHPPTMLLTYLGDSRFEVSLAH